MEDVIDEECSTRARTAVADVASDDLAARRGRFADQGIAPRRDCDGGQSAKIVEPRAAGGTQTALSSRLEQIKPATGPR
jgi:hypothetical protein